MVVSSLQAPSTGTPRRHGASRSSPPVRLVTVRADPSSKFAERLKAAGMKFDYQPVHWRDPLPWWMSFACFWSRRRKGILAEIIKAAGDGPLVIVSYSKDVSITTRALRDRERPVDLFVSLDPKGRRFCVPFIRWVNIYRVFKSAWALPYADLAYVPCASPDIHNFPLNHDDLPDGNFWKSPVVLKLIAAHWPRTATP